MSTIHEYREIVDRSRISWLLVIFMQFSCDFFYFWQIKLVCLYLIWLSGAVN